MKALIPAGLLALVVVQGSWLPHVRIAGVMPDAVLVAITSLSLLLGGLAAAPLAAGAGVALDLLSGAPLGLSAIALLVAVLLTGWWRGTIYYNGIIVFVAAAVLATAAYDAALLVGMQSLHEPVSWPAALRGVVAPSAIVNGLLAIPVGYGCSWLAARLGLLRPAV